MSRDVGLMLVLLKDAKLACNLACTVVYARVFTVQELLFSKIPRLIFHDAFISRLANTPTRRNPNHNQNQQCRRVFLKQSSRCTKLKSVDLGGAGIDNDGVTTLANALKENTTVTKINLDGNDISDEGTAALADALK